MSKLVITIAIETDIDTSALLDIAIEYGSRISEEIEGYGEEANFLEEETCVEVVSLNNV